MSFWRPTFWDIVGVLLSVVPLIVGATIIITFSVTATQVLMSLVGIALVAASVFLLFRVKERLSYPFQIDRFDSTLTFSLDPRKNIPTGKLTRFITVKMHRGSPQEHEWGIFVTDPSKLSTSDLTKKMEIEAFLKTGPDLKTSRRLKPQASLSEFRRLKLTYKLPDEALQHKRFTFSESLVLSNDFSQEDENFDITIMELAKQRKIRFEFESIDVKSARIAVIRGKREPIYQSVDVAREGDIRFFEKEFGRTRIGDVLSVRWNWNYRSNKSN